MPERSAPIVTPMPAPLGEPPSFMLDVEGSLNHLAARLESVSGDRRRMLTAGPYAHPAEEFAVRRLLAAGFAPANREGEFVMKGEARVLGFFASELPRFQQMWTVRVGERFEHVTRDVERVRPRFDVRGSGENWFDLSVELTCPSGERFSAAEIARMLQSGQKSVRLRNRKVAVFDSGLLEEFEHVLRDCDPGQRQPGVYRIHAAHAGYLAGFARAQGAEVAAPAGWGSEPQTARLELGELESVLRPYQKEGVQWLNRLQIKGFAGLLADEMGLGKTVQILAFLRTIRGKSLVVCPSSLVFNWEREAARYAPDLKTVMVTGPDREARLRQDAELFITSYPLLRRDAPLYRGLEFGTLVLDEAQHIKNPDSQNAQAAVGLRALRRFALTGTPVENSIRDIWSLMEFLMPGYLGKRDDFRERYEQEIMADPGGSAHRRLMQRLRPFILRRTKRQVVEELPEKIEQVSWCELTEEQQSLYKQLTETTRRELSELAGMADQKRARMTMLTALLRLRQACLDVRLLRPDFAPEVVSAKVALLLELLAEAIDGGHRVLVFSQFATMLRLLRDSLDAEQIDACYLDGQTKDRQAAVDRFQSGGVPVFLISLKAGGTGLNLTAADTVIHFDPWWNPAIEAQATDRAHRIGQKQVVTSYKLIARGTVEEKILALQQKKRAVIAASLKSEEPLMDGLSLEEIREMIE
jgi:superfamily II DNA or RNA helicase